MRKRLFILCVVLVAPSMLVLRADDQEKQTISKEQCLGCHGSFDKLAEKTAKFKMPSDETTTPHRYIPHSSKNVPECTACHTAHEIPLKDKSKVVKATPDLCYSTRGCHHMNNLDACKTCHGEGFKPQE
jgi:hypothetical protein